MNLCLFVVLPSMRLESGTGALLHSHTLHKDQLNRLASLLSASAPPGRCRRAFSSLYDPILVAIQTDRKAIADEILVTRVMSLYLLTEFLVGLI
jgi:hypothetical protein